MELSKRRERIESFLVDDFNLILHQEEKALARAGKTQLSVNEFHVIQAVYAQVQLGDNTMGAVARRLSITMGSLTASVSTLEKKGYLQRQKGSKDRRLVRVSPTRLAGLAHQEHEAFHSRLTDRLLSVLSEQEQVAMVKALQVIRDYLLEVAGGDPASDQTAEGDRNTDEH